MDSATLIGLVSIVASCATIVIGTMIPALSMSKAVVKALESIAQQPDEAGSLSRTLFVGIAMIESLAIYCLVIAIILIFTNPFWTAIAARGGK
jgi:F-type H+-transporting ATPase subunit c